MVRGLEGEGEEGPWPPVRKWARRAVWERVEVGSEASLVVVGVGFLGFDIALVGGGGFLLSFSLFFLLAERSRC